MINLQSLENHYQSEENMYEKLMFPYLLSQVEDKLNLVNKQQEKAILEWKKLVAPLQDKIFSIYYTTNTLTHFIREFKKELEQIAGGYDENGRLINPFELSQTQKYCTGSMRKSEAKSGQVHILKQKLQEYDIFFGFHQLPALNRQIETENNIPQKKKLSEDTNEITSSWSVSPAIFCIYYLMNIEYDVSYHQYNACQVLAHQNWMFLKEAEKSVLFHPKMKHQIVQT